LLLLYLKEFPVMSRDRRAVGVVFDSPMYEYIRVRTLQIFSAYDISVIKMVLLRILYLFYRHVKQGEGWEKHVEHKPVCRVYNGIKDIPENHAYNHK